MGIARDPSYITPNYHQQGGSIWSIGGSLQFMQGGVIQILSTTLAITAHAGGGQTNAVALTSIVNQVTTVATTADSVALPASGTSSIVVVTNQGANSMNVFPATGDSINALAVNTAFAVAAGKTVMFFSSGSGEPWYSVTTA